MTLDWTNRMMLFFDVPTDFNPTLPFNVCKDDAKIFAKMKQIVYLVGPSCSVLKHSDFRSEIGKAPMGNCFLTIRFWQFLRRWPVCWLDSFVITECVPMVILVDNRSFFLPFVYSLEKKMTLCQVTDAVLVKI